MNNIIKQKNLLKELSKSKSPYKKIEKADSKLMQAICESVFNILEGNVPLSSKNRQDLSKHENLQRKLVQKSSLKENKKFLVQSGVAYSNSCFNFISKCFLFLFGFKMNITKKYLVAPYVQNLEKPSESHLEIQNKSVPSNHKF
jgi:hypothetical protein